MTNEYQDPAHKSDQVDVRSYSAGKDSPWVLEKHVFNRFQDDEVPTQAKHRQDKRPTGASRNVERGGKCWTESEFEISDYTTPHFIKKQWFEMWRINKTLEAYYEMIHDFEQNAADTVGTMVKVAQPFARVAGIPSPVQGLSLSPQSGAASVAAGLVGGATALGELLPAATGLAVPAGASTLEAGAIVAAPAVTAVGQVVTAVTSQVVAPVLIGVAEAVVLVSVTTKIMEKLIESGEKISEGWELVSPYDGPEKLERRTTGFERVGPIRDCPKKKAPAGKTDLIKLGGGKAKLGPFTFPWYLWILFFLLLMLLLLIALAGQQFMSVRPSSPAAAGAPHITLFRSTLGPPVTTYLVEVDAADRGTLSYQWSTTATCGVFAAPNAPTTTWTHPHSTPPLPGECSAGTDHPGQITVVVTDRQGGRDSFTWGGGSAPGEVRR